MQRQVTNAIPAGMPFVQVVVTQFLGLFMSLPRNLPLNQALNS